jgi:hypothetical protein
MTSEERKVLLDLAKTQASRRPGGLAPAPLATATATATRILDIEAFPYRGRPLPEPPVSTPKATKAAKAAKTAKATKAAKKAKKHHHRRSAHASVTSIQSLVSFPPPKMTNSAVPKPGPAKLPPKAGLEDWLAEAKQCHYLPEAVMKQLCEMVKECLMEGESRVHHLARVMTDTVSRIQYSTRLHASHDLR